MKLVKKLNQKDTIKKISVVILLISFCLVHCKHNLSAQAFELDYQLINTKDMATVNVPEKQLTSESAKTNNIFQIYQEIKSETDTVKQSLTPIALPPRKDTVATLEVPKRIWYLPTEYGTITSYPSASHFALDITSPRGSAEPIYPVANGIVSSIYTDSAGAKIVTVNHNISGQNYTSQYVHLSSYAPDLYVGKPVTINDYLGFMGRTGIATGVHLHLAVVDCNIFDANDANCSTLNGFFRYGRTRYYQGFMGLQSVMNVPTIWYSR